MKMAPVGGMKMISRKKEMGVLNKEQKELRLHGTKGFPCAGYESHYTDNPDDVVPWHWHEEIEIMYIEEGDLEKGGLSGAELQYASLCFDRRSL